MSTADELEAGARALRSQLLPIPQGKVLVAWEKMGAPSSVGGLQPKDCAAWLQRHSLKLGAVPGDGRCQYIAFSRAAFNDDQFADELRRLAVLYLRLHKSTFYESMQADLQDRHHALRKLVVEKKISSDDYDGFMEALEKGLEYGNDHTLRAMTILMRLEARVIKNLNCPASAMEPRLHGVSKDPRDKVGSIKGVIYLFLDREHYSTIEDDPQPLVTGRSSSLSSDVGSVYSERPGSIHTDKEHDVAATSTWTARTMAAPNALERLLPYASRNALGARARARSARAGPGTGLGDVELTTADATALPARALPAPAHVIDMPMDGSGVRFRLAGARAENRQRRRAMRVPIPHRRNATDMTTVELLAELQQTNDDNTALARSEQARDEQARHADEETRRQDEDADMEDRTSISAWLDFCCEWNDFCFADQWRCNLLCVGIMICILALITFAVVEGTKLSAQSFSTYPDPKTEENSVVWEREERFQRLGRAIVGNGRSSAG